MEDKKISIKNILLHFRKIQTHRKWVRHYCFGLGLYKQGLFHDLSKYSPTEFWESVKYYQGTSSPIDAAKKANGYSMAWFHHRGRNFHHYENWQDDFDHGGHPILMPPKYFAEMICDYLAAGRAYMGKNFTFASENEWWKKKREACAMVPQQIKMLDFIFDDLAKHEENCGTLMTDEVFTKQYGKYLIFETYKYFKDRKDV